MEPAQVTVAVADADKKPASKTWDAATLTRVRIGVTIAIIVVGLLLGLLIGYLLPKEQLKGAPVDPSIVQVNSHGCFSEGGRGKEGGTCYEVPVFVPASGPEGGPAGGRFVQRMNTSENILNADKLRHL